MTDHTNTYPDLVNVEDWLNASGYTGEAGACHQAMSLIRKQEKRIAELEAAQLAQDKLILDYCARITELENSEPAGFPEWLEAKNARIAELEAQLSCSIVNGNDAREQCLEHVYALNAAAQRIAELEAALKPFAVKDTEVTPERRYYDMLVKHEDRVRARAALEKKK